MRKFTTMPLLLIATIVLGLQLFTVHPVQAQTSTPPVDTESVFLSHYRAIEAGDVETAMQYLADEYISVILPPPPGTEPVVIGSEPYRPTVEYLVSDNLRYDFVSLAAQGDTLTFHALVYSDLFEFAGVYPINFSGTAVVKDGTILSETWVMDPNDDQRLAAALSEKANINVVDQLYQELFVQGNLEIADEIIAPDFINNDFPEDPPGPEPIRQTSIDLRNAMPDLEITVSQWLAEGDLVASNVTFRGTFTGEFIGAPPTGDPIEWSQIDIHRIDENGQIAEVWHPIPLTLFEAIGYQLTPPSE